MEGVASGKLLPNMDFIEVGGTRKEATVGGERNSAEPLIRYGSGVEKKLGSPGIPDQN